ncbi:TonB-dependent receptor [Phenylobacterium sp.]|uniref:TonB-dependent receptor n=1 Tax=Phenylobacterium sp. TaxID=1871053 RepID=UPI0035B09DFB
MSICSRAARLTLLATGSSFALALAALAAPQAALAAEAAADAAGPLSPDAPELEQVLVTAPKGSAASGAPATAPLDAVEPTAMITRTFIEDSVADTSDYTGVLVMTPSLSGVNNNGPGLSEKDAVIRGFGDGEYNVTYDGIPFGDTNDPTHHTTAYFPASTIGAAQVDRGPGEAGDLGQATFGGSFNLFSRSLTPDPYLQQKLTVGSWNTRNVVTTLQSGELDKLHGTRITANFQELWSDGYLDYSKVREFNQFLKFETPLTDRLTLTALVEHNEGRIHEADGNGATLAQVAAYGKTFALNNDPTSPAYYGYNTITKETDFEYVRLKGDLDHGFGFENTLYTYAYKNSTMSATDVTQNAAEVASGTYPSDAVGTKAGPAGNLDIAGYDKLNQYRVYGDILRGSKDFSFGQLRGGVWYETAFTNRHRFDLDRTLGLPNPIEKAPATGPVPPADIQFLEHSKWFQYQVFADFEWRPTAQLTVTPGVKYMSFTRKVSAPVGSKTRLVGDSSTATFEKTLPFLTANYRIADNWSAYAQYAKGFLVPPLKVFYVPDAEGHGGLKPQQSTNYQLGTVFNTDRLTLDGDVYYIEFTDKFAKVGPKSDPYYTNLPGTTVYKGVEGQVSYAATEGLVVFVNGSVNSAKDDTHKQIANAPQWTAAGGAVYKDHGWSVSFINKFVGPQWADDGEPADYKIKAFNTTNLVVGYDFGRIKAQLGVYNLFDHKDVTDISINDGPTANPLDNHDQYFFQPERSYQFTLRATL